MQLSVTGIFTKEQQNSINQKLDKVSLQLGLNLKIHFEGILDHDILDRAAFVFNKLELDKQENGPSALLLISLASRRYAFLCNENSSQILTTLSLVEIDNLLQLKLKDEDYFGAITNFLDFLYTIKK
ncbi:MAG: TPM domain-containing protein [Bacteroidales bacterium]|nr:TPM domain-containing protein [Bacteroidales bacterium]